MTGTLSANSRVAPPRVVSVSEIQAALLAVRAGQFADPAAQPDTVEAAPSEQAHGAASVPMPYPPQPVPPVAPEPAAGGHGIWLLGTHGGSGMRSLTAVLPGTRRAARAWPSPSLSSSPAANREVVVLVCRGNHRGLTAAQDYARAYRDEGLAERLQLLGVIVSADAPGRTPTALRRLQRLLSGATPILGHAPWEPSWRLGPALATGEPLPWVAKLSQALSASATSAGLVAS